MKRLLILSISIIITSIAYAQLNKGLIASFSFNNQNTLDESGNQNNAVGYTVTLDTDRFGNPDYAYKFDNVTSRIELPDSLLLKDSISISLWFKTSSKGALIGLQEAPLFSRFPSAYVPILYIGDNSMLYSTFWTGNIENQNDSSTHFNDDIWHHIVMSANQTEQNVYIDNIHVGSGDGRTLITSLIYNQIGNAFSRGWPSSPDNDVSSPFKGSIDDVRIYNRPLNTIEIDSLFNVEDPRKAITELESKKITSIFPNPTHSHIQIQSNINFSYVNIIDIKGRKVTSLKNKKLIDVSLLKKGVYFLQIFDENGVVISRRKFIKN